MEKKLFLFKLNKEENEEEKKKPTLIERPELSLQEKIFAQQTPAQATFARKPTAAELEKKSIIVDLIEKSWWILVVVFILIFLAFNLNKIKQFGDWLFDHDDSTKTTTPVVETEIKSQVNLPILSGTTYKAETDFGFLNHDIFSEINYYLAGKFTSGEYANGQRIIALGKKINGEQKQFVFVRAEDGTVFLDGEKPSLEIWKKTLESYYLLGEINKKSQNIQLVEQIPSDHPDFLPINNDLVLYREKLLTETGPYNLEQETANNLALTLSFNDYQNMTSSAAANYPSLKIYGKVYSLEELKAQVSANWLAENLTIMDTYLNRATKYILVDQTGVPYIYELAYKDQYQAYQQKTLSEGIFTLQQYGKELSQYTATEDFSIYAKDFANGTTVALPDGLPSTPTIGQDLPGFIYDSAAFEEINTSFKRYIPGFTVSCTNLLEAKILQNVTTDDLEPVGKIFASQTTIYKLKDNNHQLYKFLYDLKFKNTGLNEEEIISQNHDLILSMKNYTRSELSAVQRGKKALELPTLDEYMAKNPLLIIVDSLGDFLVISEGDFITHPECVIK